jgi:hypothetical protein
MDKTDVRATGVGIGSGIIASLCCLLPIVLIFLGIGSISTALSITQYKPYFLFLSLVFMAGFSWVYLKKSNCMDGSCKMDRGRFITVALMGYAVIVLGVFYVLLPLVIG